MVRKSLDTEKTLYFFQSYIKKKFILFSRDGDIDQFSQIRHSETLILPSPPPLLLENILLLVERQPYWVERSGTELQNLFSTEERENEKSKLWRKCMMER